MGNGKAGRAGSGPRARAHSSNAWRPGTLGAFDLAWPGGFSDRQFDNALRGGKVGGCLARVGRLGETPEGADGAATVFGSLDGGPFARVAGSSPSSSPTGGHLTPPAMVRPRVFSALKMPPGRGQVPRDDS